jgi:hypothetical protein
MADGAAGDSLGLQFDTALPRGGSLADQSGAVTCHACQRTVHTEYYDVSGQPTCAECRAKIETLTETPSGIGPLVKAGLFGLAAGIAGAIIYYAVIAITDFEIGIVAILIGYMVGYAVRKGAGGRGGRRFQVLAVALTYMAVAFAYTPIVVKAALKDSSKQEEKSAAATETTPAAGTENTPAAAQSASTAEPDGTTAAVALLMLCGLVVSLPVLVVFGSLPSGLISGLIIFFGMQQAWKMTATPALAITGPYRVGTPAPTAGV